MALAEGKMFDSFDALVFKFILDHTHHTLNSLIFSVRRELLLLGFTRTLTEVLGIERLDGRIE